MARLLQVVFVVFGIFSLAFPSPIVKRDFPDPQDMIGNWSDGLVHDPSIIRRPDGKWFMFTTNDGAIIHTAPHLHGPWTRVGQVMEKSVLYSSERNDIWAPDVSKVGNMYYLYYAASGWGTQRSLIGVCTSPTMDPGTWADHGDIGILYGTSIDGKAPEWNAIDPNLFQHDLKSPFIMTFGSYWTGIHQYQMENPPLKVTGGSQWLQTNNTPPRTRDNQGPTEGAYLFWHPYEGTDYYYLFFSSGYCCQTNKTNPKDPKDTSNLLKPAGDEYKIMVCRSDNPTFGFVDRLGVDCLHESGGNLVLGSHGDIYAPGGQDVMVNPETGEVVMYHHYERRSIGYLYSEFSVGYNIIDFEDDGWPTVRR